MTQIDMSSRASWTPEFQRLDWQDVGASADRIAAILREIARPDKLRGLVGNLQRSPRLLELSEHYDLLDKLVLFEDPVSGARIRLHVFLPGYFDRPHNHRWSYGTLILRGGYSHTLYGDEERCFGTPGGISLTPVLARHEEQGSTYALHHSMVHSVTADPRTVTLVLRGPSVKPSFTIVDRVTGASWTQRGAAYETEITRATKALSPEQLAADLQHLHDMELV